MPDPIPGMKPEGIAVVPCDNVYTDSSGKLAIVGLFNRIIAPDFPMVRSKICVYVSITEIYPGTVCKVDIVHSETDVPVFQAEGPVDMEGVNPTTICDLVFELNNVVFQEEGTYYVRLFGNGHPLVQRPFEVIKKTHNSEAEDEPDHAGE